MMHGRPWTFFKIESTDFEIKFGFLVQILIVSDANYVGLSSSKPLSKLSILLMVRLPEVGFHKRLTLNSTASLKKGAVSLPRRRRLHSNKATIEALWLAATGAPEW